MVSFIRRQPPFVLLVVVSALLMLGPSFHAARIGDWLAARTFLYHGIFALILAGMLVFGLAPSRRSQSKRSAGLRELVAQNPLFLLLLTYLALPLLLALPLAHLEPALTRMQAYFEMLSCLTTTGLSVFDQARDLSDPLHLWRGLVGWFGGFLFLVAAFAILEPLSLGGFELQATIGATERPRLQIRGGTGEANERVLRYAGLVFLPYVALTFALALFLIWAGDRSLVAVIHAMGVLATSGITPLESFSTAPSGRLGEIFVFLFLFTAVTQKSITTLFNREKIVIRAPNPEVKIALVFVTIVPALLFLRHFLGAVDVADQENFTGAFRAIWGSAFSVLSFLTTTGYQSTDWEAAREWSGLGTPGTVLMALCVMGGGIATTAGGVKLLRIYALYKHGTREMGRLIHPNSVGGAGITARRIRREGAAIAWLFLMFFLIGIAVALLALTLAGQDFDAAMSLAVAALTNTGPAAFLLAPDIAMPQMPSSVLSILGLAMVFGRLEALVVIAMLNPEYWRR